MKLNLEKTLVEGTIPGKNFLYKNIYNKKMYIYIYINIYKFI